MSGWSAILEKAQKIRELRDRAGTPEEAAVAAQKLQDLLIKHQIDEYAIDGHKPDKKRPVVSIEFSVDEGMTKGRRISKGWRRTVAHTAAEAHGCKSVHWDSTSKMTFVGYQTNVEAAIDMFHYLKNVIIDLTLKGYAEHQKECEAYWHEPTSPRIWHQSFAEGAIAVIRQRLREARKQAEQVAAETSQALVVMNQDVADTYHKLFPNLHNSKGRVIRDGRAYQQGRAAGQTVSLGKEVASGSRKAIR